MEFNNRDIGKGRELPLFFRVIVEELREELY
jgi:hypothetical protein